MVGIRIKAIIILISIKKINKDIETVGIPNPIVPLIMPHKRYTIKIYDHIDIENSLKNIRSYFTGFLFIKNLFHLSPN